MKNYENLLAHARQQQVKKSKFGLTSDAEDSFLGTTDIMNNLECKEKREIADKTGVALAASAGIYAPLFAMGAFAGSEEAMITSIILGAGATAGSLAYKAIMNHLISKNYGKEKDAIASDYMQYLQENEPEFTNY